MARILPQEDYLVRMQRELKKSLEGDRSRIKWSMVIDLAKCIGCHACTLGCVAENKLPPGVVYRPVIEEEIGTYPNVRRRFFPRPCLQCQNPPCVPVCPVTATYKDEQGVTVMNYSRCIGCRYCLVACPYAARTSDFGEWYTRSLPESDGTILGGKKCADSYERYPNPDQDQNRCKQLLAHGGLSREFYRDIGFGRKIPIIGKIKVIQGIRPGTIAFSLGHGHWAYGSMPVTINDQVVPADERRSKGFHANAAMRVDPFLKNTTLSDTVGGSAVFYQSQVKLEKV
jgi:Fe-S-cluster-containing dehydrogenase component